MTKYLHITLMLILTSTLAIGCEEDSDDSNAGAGGAAGMANAGTGDTGGSGGMGATGGTGGAGTGGSGGMSATGGTGGASGMGSDEPVDIVATALAAGSFTQLAEALTTAGLVTALQGEGPFTVFAPTDDAFDAFEAENPGVLAGLSVEELTAILSYHVVSGAAVESSALMDGQLVESLAGPMLAIDLDDGVKINDATVTMADIEASNGIIHVVDKIIMPPGNIIEVATAAGSFTQLAGALTTADLVETLQGEGPFTVFAPTDAAFDAFEAANPGVIAGLSAEELGGVLTYHVLAGIAGQLDLVNGGAALTVSGSPVLFDLSDGAKIQGGGETVATISVTNVVASNGVIHVIDAVILPPADDIVATAVAAGSFTTLAGALTSQDLVETLQGEGPFTVFAPTDDAFEALSAVPSGDALTDVLLYHVVEGAIGSGNLAAGMVEMLSGDSVTVDLSDGVKIDDAGVTTANILTKNGVIHVIDTVLVPE